MSEEMKLDRHYHGKKLSLVLRDLSCMPADEYARALIRLANVADESVMLEPEFTRAELSAIKGGGGAVAWREHSATYAKGERCPQTIETLQAAWERDQELMLEQKGEISRLKETINQLRQKRSAPTASGAVPVPVPKAHADVLAERCRQIEKEGWSPAHDDLYSAAELPRAAAAYILNGANDEAPCIWPFHSKWWKPRDGRSNYIRAAALLLAEIERIDRALLAKGVE